MRAFTAIATWVAITMLGLTGCGKDVEPNLARRIVYHPGNGKHIQLEWTINKLPNGDTLMHGVMKEYYWNGSNKKSVIWVDGKRDGSAQSWYDNGNQQWQKSYEKGNKVNTWRLFFPDGNPWIVLSHNKEGGLEGTVQRWDRFETATPKEAVFSKGSCVSGDCNILALPEVVETDPQPNKVQTAKDREILADFLD